MSDIQNDILSNINALIIALYIKGITKLSVKKMIEYIKKQYNISIDEDYLGEILADNLHVDSINNGVIILLDKSEKKKTSSPEEDVSIENVNKKASEQALDNITRENRFFKVKSNEVMLDENDKNYYIHMGALKSNSDYIAERLSNGRLYCRISESRVKIDFPVNKMSQCARDKLKTCCKP